MSFRRLSSCGVPASSHSIFPVRAPCSSVRTLHCRSRRLRSHPSCCIELPSTADLSSCSTGDEAEKSNGPRQGRFRPFVRSLLQQSGPLHTVWKSLTSSPGGTSALAAATVFISPQLQGSQVTDLFTRNYVFKAGFWAWLLAQTLKIFTKRAMKGVWDLRAILDSGGLPSSHSALCTAVTTAVGLEFGLASSLFAVSLCFTLITMYDAAGVRYHSGKQAEVLNILLEDVVQGHPVSEQRLKEVLGHTPLQVIAGAVLGVLIGLLTPVPTSVVL